MQKVLISIIHITVALTILLSNFPIVKASNKVNTDLSFNGTTATCSIVVMAEKPDDKIVVSVKLYQGKTLVSEWNDMSGSGKFTFSDTATVKKRKSYTMKTQCSINGKNLSVADRTKKCN